MTPIDWAKRPIQKYADFTGRAPRAEYWWYALAIIVAAAAISIVEIAFGFAPVVGHRGPLSLLFVLALIVPGLAVTVRRLHDTDRSGWWFMVVLIPFGIVGFMVSRAVPDATAVNYMSVLAATGIYGLIALVGAIVLLALMLLPGNRSNNRYGPDPYAVS